MIENDELLRELVHDDEYGTASVLPRYDGLSTVNLLGTVVKALGGTPGAQPLRSGLVKPEMLEGIRTVLFIVVDALGYDQLVYEVQQGNMPGLAGLIRQPSSSFFPITTVYPSTTSAALVSLNTGATPLEHGNAGYQAYLPQLDTIANLLFFYLAADPKISLRRFGIDPKAWLATPTTYQRLAKAGIPSFYVNPRQFQDSPLSLMNSAGSTYYPYVAESDMFTQIRRAHADARTHDRAFIFAYWSTVDSISHYYGTHTPEHAAEVRMLDWLIRRELLDYITTPDTLLVITADHGHNNTRKEELILLNDHPEMLAMMRAAPGGDARGRYFYVKPGMREEVMRYAADHLPGAGIMLPLPEYLWLFGTGVPHPEFAARVGDLLYVPHSEVNIAYKYYSDQQLPPFTGLHGGLHRTEMLVPAILARVV